MILCAIAGYMGDDRLCYPSIKTIARYAGITPRNVRKHLTEMCWSDEKTDELRAQGIAEERIAERAAKCELLIEHALTPRGDFTANWYYLRRYPKEPEEAPAANSNGKRRARRTA